MEREDSDTGTPRFISSAARVHRGTRETGAECGQVLRTSDWAIVDAANPLDAVVRFGNRPCSKCFSRCNDLQMIHTIDHSSVVVPHDRAAVIARLPYEEVE
jgi:hypothetical protein